MKPTLNLLLFLPLATSACVTLHEEETMTPLNEQLTLSCSVDRYVMGRFASVSVTLENQTDEFKNLAVASFGAEPQDKLAVLSPTQLLALTEGYNLRQSINQTNAFLAAAPLVILTYGAVLGLAGSGGEPSGAARGAVAAGFATAATVAPVAAISAATNYPSLRPGSPAGIPAYSRTHILGETMLLAPKLAVRRYVMVDVVKDYLDPASLKFCFEGDSEHCFFLHLQRQQGISNHTSRTRGKPESLRCGISKEPQFTFVDNVEPW